MISISPTRTANYGKRTDPFKRERRVVALLWLPFPGLSLVRSVGSEVASRTDLCHDYYVQRSTQRDVVESGPDLGHFSDPPLLVLASLADGPKHGHAMIEDIVEMSG